MEGDPALIVRLVDAGSVLHQESHHVNIVIYARLKEERRERGGTSKATERSKGAPAAPCVCQCVSLCGYYVSGMACAIVTNSLHGKSITLPLIDCHVLSELLGNFGSRSIAEMPAHSRGASNTT